MSTLLLVIGIVVGYVFVAGTVYAGMNARYELDDDDWVLAAIWPLSLVWVLLYAVFKAPVAIAAIPKSLASIRANLRSKKAWKTEQSINEANRVLLETARLERELGIGGES